MSRPKKAPEIVEVPTSNETDRSPETIRRDFIKRFGAYGVGTSTGLVLLLSARTSRAQQSDGGPV